MAKQVEKFSVVLEGRRPALFDRYAGDNTTQLPIEEKAYWSSDGKGRLVLPAANISSMLSAQNTDSIAKRIGGKKWRTMAQAALSFTDIDPVEIPFERNGKPITRENANLVEMFHVARLPKGIPNPKKRPMLNLPWSLAFTISLYGTPDLSATTLKTMFEEAGIQIGIGTYRGVYGKYVISEWKSAK